MVGQSPIQDESRKTTERIVLQGISNKVIRTPAAKPARHAPTGPSESDIRSSPIRRSWAVSSLGAVLGLTAVFVVRGRRAKPPRRSERPGLTSNTGFSEIKEKLMHAREIWPHCGVPVSRIFCWLGCKKSDSRSWKTIELGPHMLLTGTGHHSISPCRDAFSGRV